MRVIDRVRSFIAGLFFKLAMLIDPTDWKNAQHDSPKIAPVIPINRTLYTVPQQWKPVSVSKEEVKTLLDKDMEDMTRGFSTTKPGKK